MPDKKFNSVFSISASVDHDRRDASDLTAEDLWYAFESRLRELRLMSGDEFFNCVDGPSETEER
jgi:hypothetical protein